MLRNPSPKGRTAVFSRIRAGAPSPTHDRENTKSVDLSIGHEEEAGGQAIISPRGLEKEVKIAPGTTGSKFKVSKKNVKS